MSKVISELLGFCITSLSYWKYANACGVFKGGQKSNPCNYRSISLTCIASKVLEHIVHSHVMKHLDPQRILTDVQHGFRAKRSTVTQLIKTTHDLAKTIQDNKSVHTAILDFSKAFDKVPYQRLLRKLEHFGIRENLLKWFESFLIYRAHSISDLRWKPIKIHHGDIWCSARYSSWPVTAFIICK